MSEKPFPDARFSTPEGELASADLFDISHDPELLHDYIQSLKQHSESTDDGSAVSIYRKVSIFQQSMQYLEEFALYFTGYAQRRESFIQTLLTGYGHSFYDHIEQGKTDTYLVEHDVEQNYTEVINRIFGYSQVDTFQRDDDEDYTGSIAGEEEEVKDEKLAELIDVSVKSIKRRISKCANFYIRFSDIYNAVKHGTRVVPLPENEFRITLETADGEETIEPVEDYAMFLCKDELQQPYAVYHPIDVLSNHALSIVELIHEMFVPMKQVSEAQIHGEDKFRTASFESAEGSGNTLSYATIWNRSSAFVLPADQAANYESAARSRDIAVNITQDGSTTEVRTELDDQPSDEYPVMTSLVVSGTSGLKPDYLLNFSGTIHFETLDVKQHWDLLKADERMRSGRYELNFVDDRSGDVVISDTLEEPLFPDLPELLSDEISLLLFRLQMAAERRIPVPVKLNEEQEEILEGKVGESLNSGGAETILSQLEDVDSSRYLNLFFVWVDEDGDVSELEHVTTQEDGSIRVMCYEGSEDRDSGEGPDSDQGEQMELSQVDTFEIGLSDLSKTEFVEFARREDTTVTDLLSQTSPVLPDSDFSPDQLLRVEPTQTSSDLWQTTESLYVYLPRSASPSE
ncbi:hypothetical protein [Halomarina ordinaria]|uniref:Uncharacterized protein n=1 Tax=Halomarina ordinaria TaxID=3033939 RepID=A0ABD5UGQ2_9EURY|nr:hypothetical protein [Halomarina sp. PSRA2]